MSQIDQILKIIEKSTAASPTLIFDFLIFDIRNWNLTGHHIIQDERQQTNVKITTTDSLVYSIPIVVTNALISTGIGIVVGVTGALISTTVEADNVIKAIGHYFGLP